MDKIKKHWHKILETLLFSCLIIFFNYIMRIGVSKELNLPKDILEYNEFQGFVIWLLNTITLIPLILIITYRIDKIKEND